MRAFSLFRYEFRSWGNWVFHREAVFGVLTPKGGPQVPQTVLANKAAGEHDLLAPGLPPGFGWRDESGKGAHLGVSL